MVSREGDIINEVYLFEQDRTQNTPIYAFVFWKVALCIYIYLLNFFPTCFWAHSVERYFPFRHKFVNIN